SFLLLALAVNIFTSVAIANPRPKAKPQKAEEEYYYSEYGEEYDGDEYYYDNYKDYATDS
ncbi:Uncharacterized protein FKW44_017318, partial [Caligus rogercresseyi]